MKKILKNKKIISIIAICISIVFLLVVTLIIKNQVFASKTIESFAIESENTVEQEIQEVNKDENEEIKEEISMMEENIDETKVDIKKEENSNKNNKAKYYIKVNYGANCVTIYAKDDEGEYTIPVKAMICSSGVATPTSGVYKMGPRYRWCALFGGVYGQYSVKITGNILFHSVPYLEQSEDTLEYWEYDKLGSTASAGCIRLMVSDALWIYSNCENGTYVEFYSSQDPGPLGKPSARKISANEVCRNWDPTDPDSNNPWRTYQEVVTLKEEKRIEDKNLEEKKVEEKNDEQKDTDKNEIKTDETIPEENNNEKSLDEKKEDEKENENTMKDNSSEIKTDDNSIVNETDVNVNNN